MIGMSTANEMRINARTTNVFARSLGRPRVLGGGELPDIDVNYTGAREEDDV